MNPIFPAFTLLVVSILSARFVIFANLSLNFNDLLSFAVLILSWSISISLTQKYKQNLSEKKLTYVLAPYIKSGVLMITMPWLLALFIKENPQIGHISLAAAIIFTLAELVILFLYLAFRVNRQAHNSSKTIIENRIKNEQSDLELAPREHIAKPIDLHSFFNQTEMQNIKQIKNLILSNVEPGTKAQGRGTFVSSSNDLVLKSNEKSLSMLVCNFRLNDIRCLNRFLLSCYNKLLTGGWLVGKYIPLGKVKEKLQAKLSRFLYSIFSPFHFLFYRVFPKIPKFNRIYFLLTGGKNRVLSGTEVMGRLHFCGFDVLDELNLDKENYFIARKIKTTSQEKNPSYYPIIKLDRVGYKGKIVKTYKIRTMYPFSEFLQKKIFEEKQITSSGKFKEDYRITGWGRILRKFWLDELPQFINWLRGDLKLVGIRAMSQHYFSLYPKEYQDLFIQVKPGLIPPLFDESTKDFSEIVKIESSYLKKYLDHSVKTDFSYFLKTMSQIFIKKTRGS